MLRFLVLQGIRSVGTHTKGAFRDHDHWHFRMNLQFRAGARFAQLFKEPSCGLSRRGQDNDQQAGEQDGVDVRYGGEIGWTNTAHRAVHLSLAVSYCLDRRSGNDSAYHPVPIVRHIDEKAG